MLTATLFIVTPKTANKPVFINREIDKLWYVHVIEYYTELNRIAIKTHWLLIYVTMFVNHKIIVKWIKPDKRDWTMYDSTL